MRTTKLKTRRMKRTRNPQTINISPYLVIVLLLTSVAVIGVLHSRNTASITYQRKLTEIRLQKTQYTEKVIHANRCSSQAVKDEILADIDNNYAWNINYIKKQHENFTSISETLFATIIVIIGVLLMLLPYIIAGIREISEQWWILLVLLLTVWFVLPWFFCCYVAFTRPKLIKDSIL